MTQFISALNCVVSNTCCYHWGHCWLSLLVNWRRGFSCTHPWRQHVHLQCYTGVWHSRVCAALRTQRYSLCPHCVLMQALPQPLSRHSASYSYRATAPTAYVYPLRGIHRTQWGNKYRNTTSTHYFPIPSPSSPLSPPPDMGDYLTCGGVHFSLSLSDRNTPSKQTPRISTTDW